MKVWTLTTENPNGDVATGVVASESELSELFVAALDGWVEDAALEIPRDTAEWVTLAQEQGSFLTVEVNEHDVAIPSVPGSLIGRTVANVEYKDMAGRDTFKDTVTWERTVIHFTDNTSVTFDSWDGDTYDEYEYDRTDDDGNPIPKGETA